MRRGVWEGLGFGVCWVGSDGIRYRHGRIWRMDIGVRYTLLIFPQIFTIALTVWMNGDRELNECLEIIVLVFFCPVSLGRHPSAPSFTSATRGDSFC